MSALDFNANIVTFCAQSNLSSIPFCLTFCALYNVVYKLCFTQKFLNIWIAIN